MDNRDQIEEIKGKLDIASVILQYVPNLKRSGRNYFGLCPFHKEKTPSFSVNPELGLFKCFGCGEGGDVIKFLEKIESLDFPSALELAAKKAGVVLKKNFSPESSKNKQEKDRLLEANKLAAKFFNYVLTKHKAGEHGREYLAKRKIPDQQVKEFVLGYAPRSFNSLKDFLNKKGYKDAELVKWGLLVEKNSKVYDKFRGRLMFTIINPQGEVIGFTGRKIFEEDMGPKYLNSPETLVYKKSYALYGLFQARETIRKEGFVIIVEGNVDPITSHAKGIKNIVAPMGTALTIEQLKLLKRYCDKVYFALDNDPAGQKALIRSFELAEQAGLESYIVDTGSFKSPDELIMGGEDWAKTVQKPKDVVEHLLDLYASKYDLTNSKYKAKYIADVLPLIVKVQSDVAAADYLKKISEISDISIEVLQQELKKHKGNKENKGVPINNGIIEQLDDNNLSKKMSLQDLLIEYISVLVNNQDQLINEHDVAQVLGDGPAMQVYKYIVGEPSKIDIEKYSKIIEEIKLKPDVKIDDTRLFQHVCHTLGQRINTMRAQIEIKKIKKSMTDDDEDSLQKVNEALKLLKS